MRPLWMNVFYEWMFFMNECFFMNEWMNELLCVCYFYWVSTTFLLKNCMILMFLMNALLIIRPTDWPTNTAYYRVCESLGRVYLVHLSECSLCWNFRISDLSLSVVIFLRAKASLVLRDTIFILNSDCSICENPHFHWKKNRLNARGAMAYLKTRDSVIFMNALPTNQPTDRAYYRDARTHLERPSIVNPLGMLYIVLGTIWVKNKKIGLEI